MALTNAYTRTPMLNKMAISMPITRIANQSRFNFVFTVFSQPRVVQGLVLVGRSGRPNCSSWRG